MQVAFRVAIFMIRAGMVTVMRVIIPARIIFYF